MNTFAPYPSMSDTGAQSSQQRNVVDSTTNPPNPSRMPTERNGGAAPMRTPGAPLPYGGGPGDKGGFPQAGLPRSPPKNKNTQHVPCKFFLQGQCQAGRMCPFSHDVESSTRPAPCKYFAKGGCKFGRKCALLHITPDGTVVNQGPRYGAGPVFPPTQIPPAAYPQHPPGLLSMQAQGLEPAPNSNIPSDFDNYHHLPRNGNDYPAVDFAYTSASPTYGSPPQDNYFAGSPPGKGLSVLDAPLPNSFDSNGISMAARNGPFAASVPSRFGVESPPASLPRKSQLGNTALRDLHNSVFGNHSMDGVPMGSSPPSGPDEPLTFPKRPLHSDRLHAPRYQMISASLGTKLPTQSFEYSDDGGEGDDDDGNTDREEDLLPASLRELIPESRTRAAAAAQRTRPDETTSATPATFLAAQRRTISGHGTPQDSKVGSPYSASPSRFSGLFNRAQNGGGTRVEESHVGSPLRNAGFAFSSTSAAASRHTSGDLSPTVGSPPRQASMSVLTQELQRTKLEAARSQAAAASVGMSRTLSNGSTGGRASLDRAVSGSSVGRERIDEEQDLFDMEEVGAPSRSAPRAIPGDSNGSNGAWGTRALGSSPGMSEPTFGAIGGHRTAK